MKKKYFLVALALTALATIWSYLQVEDEDVNSLLTSNVEALAKPPLPVPPAELCPGGGRVCVIMMNTYTTYNMGNL